MKDIYRELGVMFDEEVKYNKMEKEMSDLISLIESKINNISEVI